MSEPSKMTCIATVGELKAALRFAAEHPEHEYTIELQSNTFVLGGETLRLPPNAVIRGPRHG